MVLNSGVVPGYEESTAGDPASSIEDGFEEKSAGESAMSRHFSLFSGSLVPNAGFVAPIIGQRSRNSHPSMSTAEWSPTGSSPVPSTVSWDFPVHRDSTAGSPRHLPLLIATDRQREGKSGRGVAIPIDDTVPFLRSFRCASTQAFSRTLM